MSHPTLTRRRSAGAGEGRRASSSTGCLVSPLILILFLLILLVLLTVCASSTPDADTNSLGGHVGTADEPLPQPQPRTTDQITTKEDGEQRPPGRSREPRNVMVLEKPANKWSLSHLRTKFSYNNKSPVTSITKHTQAFLPVNTDCTEEWH